MKDNLLSTRIVTYRVQPTTSDTALLSQYEALQAVDEPTDEQSEELAKLSAERIIVDEYKFTLSAYSVMQRAKRDSLLNKGKQWFEEQTGITWVAHFALSGAERDPLNRELVEIAWGWSAVIPAIIKVEQRQVDVLSDYKTEWETTQIPQGWNDIGTFANSVKDDLEGSLRSHTYILNPFLVGISQDEEAKKFGVVSVS